VKKNLHFRVLGPFELCTPGGKTIEFSHRKGHALLAYLSVTRTRPQPRELLATLLWGRTGDERARHNLRQTLSKIRSLCHDLIETRGDQVAVNSDNCSIDLVAFEDLAHAEEIADLQSALDLYRGDLLEGYSSSEPVFQDWLQAERLRLRKLACEVAGRLAALLAGEELDQQAIGVLNRLLRIDPANESAHRELMKLLARTGRRSDALRQYQECVTALRHELDVEPGAETRQLLADLQQSRSGTTIDGPEIAVAPTAVTDDDSDPPIPRRLAAILYADVARYSHLTSENEDATHRTLRRYLDLIAARVEDHGGRIAHYAGDAALAQFNAAVAALSCAVVIQRELGEMNREVDASRQVRFRIGVNSGDVIEDRGDIFGDGVNVAARLEALAEPGGVCISDAVRVAVGNRVNADYLFIGEQKVRNIAEPVRAYRVTTCGSGTSGVSTTTRSESGAEFALPGKPSLVVKPFANMSDDPGQDYFAEGLTKDISIALVKIPGIFLAMDESPSAGLSRQMSIVEIGHKFGVRYVLNGGVRRNGGRVRVNAELIEADSGRCLWAERFDRELHDLFSIQDEITEEIVTAMDVKLMSGEAARFLRKALTDPTALDLAYRGWHALYGGGLQHVRDAQHYFEEVIRLEPKSPVGYASAAVAYWSEAGFGRVVVDSPAMDRAAELARQALELGDTTGFANLALALVHLARHEYEQAMVQATEGVTARPSCNGAYAIKSSVLNYLGRPQEAIEFAQYAVRLTPVYPAEFPAILATAYHDSGRHADAITAANASLQLRADDIDPLLILAASNVARGNLDHARDAATRVRDLDPSFKLSNFAATQPYRDPNDLERLLDRLRQAGLDD
jgi:TolB-like protein/DNA-binding SARP family transcriptional activator